MSLGALSGNDLQPGRIILAYPPPSTHGWRNIVAPNVLGLTLPTVLFRGNRQVLVFHLLQYNTIARFSFQLR